MNENFSEISNEERLAYMLGHPIVGLKPLFNREEFCPSCGSEHKSPWLLDMYGSCSSCHATLRESYHLQRRYADIPQLVPLEILFATYGDPLEPLTAIDVTAIMKERVKYYKNEDRLAFRIETQLNEVFKCDPAPGKSKQLRIRYRIDGVFATLLLSTLPSSQFPSPILLLRPTKRHLKIIRALYGHPKGRSSTGAMCTDVTEIVQGFVDLMGGSYLNLSPQSSVSQMFGDPCPGYTKDLRIEYEVSGRNGSIVRDEFRGHLKKRIYIEETPTVAPLLLVDKATYGVTPTSRRDRLRQLEKELIRIKTLEHKIHSGLYVSPDDYNYLNNNKQKIIDDMAATREAPISFLDITTKLQRLADKGGISLKLDKETFDPNLVFGNPMPGALKFLEVNLTCPGHDSERFADSREVTGGGFPRNYITNKSARFVVPVVENRLNGKARLAESVVFESSFAGPIITIVRATYGDFSNSSHLIDCTTEVQLKVKGQVLCIEQSENLNHWLVRDPCPGIHKQLRIEYITRGFYGNVRVREKDDLLVAGVQLGYLPESPQDD